MYPLIEHKPQRAPWNKGRLVGQKPPLKAEEIWTIRIHLELQRISRDLALFNLPIDSELRGCDLVKLKVSDIAHGRVVQPRARIIQQKTMRAVQFEITDQARLAVERWMTSAGLRPDDHLFLSRTETRSHISIGFWPTQTMQLVGWPDAPHGLSVLMASIEAITGLRENPGFGRSDALMSAGDRSAGVGPSSYDLSSTNARPPGVGILPSASVGRSDNGQLTAVLSAELAGLISSAGQFFFNVRHLGGEFCLGHVDIAPDIVASYRLQQRDVAAVRRIGMADAHALGGTDPLARPGNPASDSRSRRRTQPSRRAVAFMDVRKAQLVHPPRV